MEKSTQIHISIWPSKPTNLLGFIFQFFDVHRWHGFQAITWIKNVLNDRLRYGYYSVHRFKDKTTFTKPRPRLVYLFAWTRFHRSSAEYFAALSARLQTQFCKYRKTIWNVWYKIIFCKTIRKSCWKRTCRKKTWEHNAICDYKFNGHFPDLDR